MTPPSQRRKNRPSTSAVSAAAPTAASPSRPRTPTATAHAASSPSATLATERFESAVPSARAAGRNAASGSAAQRPQAAAAANALHALVSEAQQRRLEQQHDHERHRAEGADRVVAHDLEPPLPGRPAERVRGVGERVEVQRTGEERGDAEAERGRGEGRQRSGGDVDDAAGERADRTADEREERCGAANGRAVELDESADRDPRQERDRGERRLNGPHPSTPAWSKVAISASSAMRRSKERQRERRAGPLAEPELEVEQRAEPERAEPEPVPRLGREVPRDHVRDGRRLQARGDERRRGDDEPVEHDREPFRCGAQRDPREDRDLEPAERGEHVDGVVEAAVGGERPVDHLRLPAHAVRVEPGSRPADGGGRNAEQRCVEGARGGRVPDAHVAERDEVDATPQALARARLPPRVRRAPAPASSRGRARRSLYPARCASNGREGRRAPSRTPASTTTSSASTSRDRTEIAAPPEAKTRSICRVTSGG